MLMPGPQHPLAVCRDGSLTAKTGRDSPLTARTGRPLESTMNSTTEAFGNPGVSRLTDRVARVACLGAQELFCGSPNMGVPSGWVLKALLLAVHKEGTQGYGGPGRNL
eukprot:1138557-Pelagomonas_calceolata.AAC.3